MAIDEGSIFPPSIGDEPPRPQGNRTILGALVVLLIVAVLLALWFLVIDDDSGDGSGDEVAAAGPTPLPIPSSTPSPEISVETTGDDAEETAPLAEATPEPTAIPTPVPEGFEACGADIAPSATASYIVDTTSTPLNQRAEPDVTSELAGTFDPGQTGLVFTGECLVNLNDQYVWWEINNGTTNVWVASDFVSAR